MRVWSQVRALDEGVAGDLRECRRRMDAASGRGGLPAHSQASGVAGEVVPQQHRRVRHHGRGIGGAVRLLQRPQTARPCGLVEAALIMQGVRKHRVSSRGEEHPGSQRASEVRCGVRGDSVGRTAEACAPCEAAEAHSPTHRMQACELGGRAADHRHAAANVHAECRHAHAALKRKMLKIDLHEVGVPHAGPGRRRDWVGHPDGDRLPRQHSKRGLRNWRRMLEPCAPSRDGPFPGGYWSDRRMDVDCSGGGIFAGSRRQGRGLRCGQSTSGLRGCWRNTGWYGGGG